MFNNGMTPQPGAPSRAKLFEELVAFYAAALEYPTEVFSEEVELEAELGIDSVKQTELLAQISEKYNLPPRPADFRLGDYPRLGQLVDFIFARLPQAKAAPSAPDASAPSTPPAPEISQVAPIPGVPASPVFSEFWEKFGSSIMGYIYEEFETFLKSKVGTAPKAPAQAKPVPPTPPSRVENIVKDSIEYKPLLQEPAYGLTRTRLFEEMVAFYAAALEYPTEVFSKEVELEAELGVDSVKQTELLAQISEKYNLPPRPADFRLGDYPRLGQLVDFIYSRLPNQPKPVLLATANGNGNGNGHHH